MALIIYFENVILILDFRDDYQDAEIVRDDFAVLAGSIVYESDKLITIGLEVANVCTNKTLKKVMTGSKVNEYIYIPYSLNQTLLSNSCCTSRCAERNCCNNSHGYYEYYSMCRNLVTR